MFQRTDDQCTNTDQTCDQCGHTYPEWVLNLEFTLFSATSMCAYCDEVTSFTEVTDGLTPERRQHD